MNRPDLSISLITYKNKGLLEGCLESIYKNTKKTTFEILLVNNVYRDQSSVMVRKKFPKVKLTDNKKNLLFIKSHNQNLKKAQGRYFLILNEDTLLPSKSIDKMVRFMDQNPDVGIASCRQIDENGIIDNTCSRFPTPLTEIFESVFITKFFLNLLPVKSINRMLANYRYIGWKRNTIKEVDVVPGSFFMGRSELLQTVGFLDPGLLFFYVEPDYCFRAKQAGYKVIHNGKVQIMHLKAQGLLKTHPFFRYQITEYSLLAYYRKYFGFVWWIILWLLLRPNWLYFKLFFAK